MTQGAWIFMLSVWTVVIGMTGFCFYKLLTSKRQLNNGDEPND
ncbi:MAG TPA: hypothetical protein PKD86_02715 [Gemmatales bacterium]|nr:hypothetical protein [Gemmatales bacterium]HMP58243.1 hypothetical protein [Gemmatales bacterium]